MRVFAFSLRGELLGASGLSTPVFASFWREILAPFFTWRSRRAVEDQNFRGRKPDMLDWLRKKSKQLSFQAKRGISLGFESKRTGVAASLGMTKKDFSAVSEASPTRTP
jgi:hypothetical protein